MTFLVATLAGGLGAVCRYLLAGYVHDHSRTFFPLGTLVVNLAGAFLIGGVVGTDVLPATIAIGAVGFLGGFSTFSTWMVETIRLGVTPFRLGPTVNLALTLIAGVTLAAVGYSLTN